MSNENLKNVFDYLDTRKSGFINRTELLKFVDLSEPLGDELSFDQFIDLLQS